MYSLILGIIILTISFDNTLFSKVNLDIMDGSREADIQE